MNEDTKELQDLFEQNSNLEAAKPDVFDDLGKLTRQLHETLHELGLDKSLASAAATIPDARDRLKYVADLTEKAADRVLNSTDKIQPLNDTLAQKSQEFENRWNEVLTHDVDLNEFAALVRDTRNHFSQMTEYSSVIRSQLMEIVMAQDFQDLTGQMIKKLTIITAELETKLLEILIEHAPSERPELAGELLGPSFADQRPESVSNQEEVDDLLASLGF